MSSYGIAQDMETDPDVRFWLNQIEAATKWHKDWYDQGKDVNDRFINKQITALASPNSFRMNVLYSNVETLKPALYAKTATPNVTRRFRDRDPVGRWAAIVLERVEEYELDTYDDDYNYRSAIEDYLLPGRGQIWVNYDPTVQGKKDDLRDPQRLIWECCKVRHINWRDFLTNPARTWDEVWWVAKREYLTVEEAKAQRLDTSAMTFEAQKNDPQAANKEDTSSPENIKKAAVWEIWSKTHGKVYFVSNNSPKILRTPAAPGLKFSSFFPCPRPLTTTTTPDSIIPIPDYLQYKDQAKEIDRLTQRINLLTKALRVAGVYDASQDSLSRLLEDTDNNILVPCETYAVLAGQGGVEGSISFFPIKDLIAALQQCYESRDQAIQVMYQVTGISDIARGATDPRETLGAQQLKSQWGSLRIRDRQREVQRFIRDTFRLKAEVHAQQFQPDTLLAMSNVPLATKEQKAQLQQRVQIQQQAQAMAQQNPQAAQQIAQSNPQLAQQIMQPLTPKEQEQLKEPSWNDVVALLRSSELRGFAVDIETDSTIQADEMAEKQARTEFVTGMTQFVEQWGPIVQQQPKAAALAGELMLFSARAFKTADSLETAIEEFVDDIQKSPPAPPPGQAQNPKDIAEAQAIPARLQLDAQKQQSEAANKQLAIKTEAQTKLATHAMTLQADAAQGHADRAADSAQAEAEGQRQQTGENRELQAIMSAIQGLTQQQMQLANRLDSITQAMNPVGSA